MVAAIPQSGTALKTEESGKQSWLASGPAIVLYIAVAKLLLHLLTASRYGYFGAQGHRRPPELFPVGTPELHRRDHHRPGGPS